MRNTFIGTALLLFALYGVAPLGASTIAGLPAQARLEAGLTGGNIVLVKKNKRKNRAQRHKLRKKLGAHRAYRQRRSAHRHIEMSPHGQDFVIIFPMDPRGYAPMAPQPELMPTVPERRRALMAPSYTAPEDPYLAGPAPILPDEDRSVISGGAAPSSTGLSRITCDQGADIVSDFGFSDIQAQGCSGTAYDFAATRDGQSYRIKMQSSDGKLTEVRRQ